MPHVSIIGGGIAGLSAAWYLQSRADATGQELAYTLFETDSRLGGKILTQRRDGLVMEAGPDSFLTQRAWGQRLCRELGIDRDLVPMGEKGIYILKGHRLIRFPAGFRLAVPTQWKPLITTPLFSPLGKLRMAMEPFVRTRLDPADESLADFIRRRLGREALDTIGEPLMASIHSADPEALSMAAAFPMLQALERNHGSLIRGFKRTVAKPPGASTIMSHSANVPFLSLKGGLSQMVDRLQSRLSGHIHLGCGVHHIERVGGRLRLHPTRGEPLLSDAVILATPAPAAADILAPMAPELAEALRTITYSATATINLAYRRADLDAVGFDGIGFVTSGAYGGDLRALTVSSEKFPHRAPDGQVLLRAFAGGHGHADALDLADDELLRRIQTELHTLIGLDAPPVTHHIHRWRQATPQYRVGHLDRVEHMERIVAEIPGLYLTGAAYRGIGIPNCIGDARATVIRLTNALGWPEWHD